MKIIDTHIRAQSMFGLRNNTWVGSETAQSRHPFTGAAWTAFIMPGDLPANESAIAQIFKQDSLADLYNKSIGVARGLASFIVKTNVVQFVPQANFFYKGVSFYKRQWGVNYRALMPNRITETATSKRTLTQLLAGTCLADADFRPETVGLGSIIVEFDNPVRLTHIQRNGLSFIYTVNAIDDQGVETSLGTWSPMSGDTTMYVASNPQTAKRFRIFATGTFTTMGPITLLTDVTDYTAPPALGNWVVVAHTNTRVCGDFEKSPLIPYFAEVLGHGNDATQKPFTLRALASDAENILYCPKIRFNNRRI